MGKCQAPCEYIFSVHNGVMEKPLTKHNAEQRSAALKRCREVAKMKRDGLSFDEIGEALGISRQRAYQLYARITGLRNIA